MKIGYGKPLYVLPFDHRSSYVSDMFHFDGPLNGPERFRVAESKQIIYEGFKRAVAEGVPKECAGILVDEELGAGVLRDAAQNCYVTALPVERSGQAEFDFEYGEDFGEHIEKFDPTFAKALVRYNAGGDAALNRRQAARLRRLSNYCRGTHRHLMLELLVPPTRAQLESVGGYPGYFDLDLRPGLMVEAIRSLQDAGVEPDVWKVEGMDRREDCAGLVEVARRDGRGQVGCIVLGRGADKERVVRWLKTAAGAPGFIGFAVGRSTFWPPVAAYEAGENTSEETAAFIAARFREWVDVFERARSRSQTWEGAGVSS